MAMPARNPRAHQFDASLCEGCGFDATLKRCKLCKRALCIHCLEADCPQLGGAAAPTKHSPPSLPWAGYRAPVKDELPAHVAAPVRWICGHCGWAGRARGPHADIEGGEGAGCLGGRWTSEPIQPEEAKLC